MTKRFTLFTLFLCLSFSAAGAPQLLSPVPDVPASEFELIDLDDQMHRLEDYKGKPVIVNFWATWCPPCREEMPSMERAWQKIQAEDIAMIGINVGEDFDTVFGFTGQIEISFPLLLDSDGAESRRWPIRGLPTTYVLNTKGEIVYQAIGGRDWNDDEILDLVRALREE